MRSGEKARHSIVEICCYTMNSLTIQVGMGIVALEHCSSFHVSYKGDSYWDKNFMDVAMCIQDSALNGSKTLLWSNYASLGSEAFCC